jgi:hypothetical protein
MTTVREDWTLVNRFVAEQEQRREREAGAQAAENASKIEAQAAENEALIAPTRAEQVRADGERRLKTGLAFGAVAVGIAAVAAAVNLTRQPKIIEVPKIQVVKVPEIQIVEKPFVVKETTVVEKPVDRIVKVPVVEHLDPVSPPSPQPPLPSAPPVGATSTVQQFTGSKEFNDAEISGRIVSHVNGVKRPGKEFDGRVAAHRDSADGHWACVVETRASER